MATWRDIADEELDPSAPVTSDLMYALARNVEAMAEGASGAVRIVGEAIKDLADFSALTISAATTVEIDIGVTLTEGETATTDTTWVQAYGWSMDKYTGTVRVSFRHRAIRFTGSSAIYSYARLLKNGSSLTSWNTTSASWQTRTYDVTFSDGDDITIEHYVSTSGGDFGESQVSQPTLQSNQKYGYRLPIEVV